MSDSYLAPSRAPRQLDIIADTALADLGNGIHSSTAKRRKSPMIGAHFPKSVIRAIKIEAEKGGQTLSEYVRQTMMARLSAAGALPKDECSLDDGNDLGNGIHSSTAAVTLKRIEAQRIESGTSISNLCAEARVHPNTYRELRLGNCKPKNSTLTRLAYALQRIRAGKITEAERAIVQSFTRLLTAEFCRGAGCDPQVALSQSFDAENTNDPTWLQASRMRRRAIYILVEVIGISKAKIANAIGISRQAVHKTVAAIECDRMNNDEFDALMQAMADQVKSEK